MEPAIEFVEHAGADWQVREPTRRGWSIGGMPFASLGDALDAVRQGAAAQEFLVSRRRYPMKTISTSELKARCDKPGAPTLVNTLSPEKFEATKIPGAVNIPLENGDFAARVEKEAGGKNKPVIVYCGSRQCDSSEKAAQKLEAAGFTAVTRYTDGAAGWQKEAGEVPAGHCS
jgi:rhodanese-related sulfurtransferase